MEAIRDRIRDENVLGRRILTEAVPGMEGQEFSATDPGMQLCVSTITARDASMPAAEDSSTTGHATVTKRKAILGLLLHDTTRGQCSQ